MTGIPEIGFLKDFPSSNNFIVNHEFFLLLRQFIFALFDIVLPKKML